MNLSFTGMLRGNHFKNLGFDPNEMKMAIHFYLHFQYNAFFVLAVFAMMSRHGSTDKGLRIPSISFLVGVIGTYFLTIQWAMNQWLVYVGVFSAVVQLIGGLWLLKRLLPTIYVSGSNSGLTRTEISGVIMHFLKAHTSGANSNHSKISR